MKKKTKQELDINKFDALTSIRAAVLEAIRKELQKREYLEVTTASLVNIAGSCENPYASFTLNYYGREAHLSQSAQLQLEALVLQLNRGFFAVNNSFREENYDDPEAAGRRLSEFTLIEPECPYENISANEALERIITTEEEVIKAVIKVVLTRHADECELLGGDTEHLQTVLEATFERITYDDALKLLNHKNNKYTFGDDLDVREEREILAHFNNVLTFVTHYPAEIKFFNMKRTPDAKRVYSVDLLAPRLGEIIGGAVRENDAGKIKQYLVDSSIGKYLRARNQDPLNLFSEYINVLERQEVILRGGFGIGFERLIGFLVNSNDILETIAYRSLTP